MAWMQAGVCTEEKASRDAVHYIYNVYRCGDKGTGPQVRTDMERPP